MDAVVQQMITNPLRVGDVVVEYGPTVEGVLGEC